MNERKKGPIAGFFKLIDNVLFRILLVFLGLSVAELGIRLYGFQPWTYDQRNGIRDLFNDFDPTIGWIPRPRESGSIWTSEFEHNETILPNRTRLVVPTPSVVEAKRLLVLGDSAIFGWGLNDEETFASRLAQRLPHFQVVNGAVPGYGTLQSLLWMERLLPEVRPKYVILGYAEYYLSRDTCALDWLIPSAAHSTRNNVYAPYARINEDQFEIIPAGWIFYELPGRTTFALMRLIEESVAGFSAYSRVADRNRIAKEIFRHWARTVRQGNAVPIVFFWAKDNSQSFFREFLIELGVEVVDCSTTPLSEEQSKLRGDGHPSAALVEYWADCLQKSGPF